MIDPSLYKEKLMKSRRVSTTTLTGDQRKFLDRTELERSIRRGRSRDKREARVRALHEKLAQPVVGQVFPEILRSRDVTGLIELEDALAGAARALGLDVERIIAEADPTEGPVRSDVEWASEELGDFVHLWHNDAKHSRTDDPTEYERQLGYVRQEGWTETDIHLDDARPGDALRLFELNVRLDSLRMAIGEEPLDIHAALGPKFFENIAADRCPCCRSRVYPHCGTQADTDTDAACWACNKHYDGPVVPEGRSGRAPTRPVSASSLTPTGASYPCPFATSAASR
jgi:hypothetical protein